MTIALVATTITFTAGNTLQAEEQALSEISQETTEPEKADAPATTSEPEQSEPVTEKETVVLDSDSADDHNADQENTETAAADGDLTEEQEENAAKMPAQKFSGKAGNGISVNVSAPEGAFPEGTTMNVSAISDSRAMALVEGQVEDATEAKGVDITFRHEGKEIEPKKAIKVQFRNADLEGDNFSVFHVSDGGSVSEVSASGATSSGATFKASDFSIYIYVGDENEESVEADVEALATYKFKVDGKTVDTQTVKDGDTLLEPEVPQADGKEFLGWYEGNKEFKGFGLQSNVTDGEHILVAKFDEAYCVYFLGTDGNTVVHTAQGHNGDVINADWVNLGNGQAASAWYISSADRPVASVTIDGEDVFLKPIVAEGHWITFDSKGGSYIDPAFYTQGEIIAAPADPERPGYDFNGWKKDGVDFSFSGTLDSDITVEASWSAKTVEYRVIHWTENADDDEYSFEESQVLTGEIGEMTAANAKSLNGFTAEAVEQETIKGDGTTIVNIYYKRNVYFVTFLGQDPRYICGKKQHTEHTGECFTISDGSISDSATSNPGSVRIVKTGSAGGVSYQVAYHKASGWFDRDAYYLVVGGKYYKIEKYNANATISKKSCVIHAHTIECIDPNDVNTIVAKHGQYIGDKWPGGAYYVGANTSTCQAYLEVMPVGGFKFYNKVSGSNNTAIAKYYVEKLDGSGYELHHQDEVAVQNGATVTAEDRYALRGFTLNASKSTKDGGKYNGAEFYYDRNTYKIKYINGNSESTVSKKYQASIDNQGATPVLPSSASKDAVFVGWFDNEMCEGSAYDFSGKTMPARNLTFYAKWMEPTYTVTAHSKADGGKTVTTTVSSGAVLTENMLPKVELAEGETFVGWVAREEGKKDRRVMLGSLITSNVSIYPIIAGQGNGYTITYDAGEYGTSPTDSHKYIIGAKAEVKKATGIAREGYVFLGWTDGHGIYQPGEEIEFTTGNIILVPAWGEVGQKTEISYFSNFPEGSGKEDITVTKGGMIDNNGAVQLAAVEDLDGFDAGDEYEFAGWSVNGNVYKPGTKVRADVYGSNVLSATWKKVNKHKVSYEYKGDVPEGAGQLPANRFYKEGARVTIAAAPTAPAGYTFTGWKINGREASAFNMGSEDVVITGSFAPKKNTAYKVEHYLQNADNDDYTLAATDNMTGTTGEMTAAEAKADFAGFTAKDFEQKKIAGNGSTVVKIYYDRNKHKVTYQYTGTVPTGASALPEGGKYKYGAEVTVADPATAPAGYTFSGWSRTESFNMPDEDVVITGSFTANENTAYKVEHYQQNVEGIGYTLADTDTLAETTDTRVTAVAKTYTGFTLNEDAQGTVKSGVVKGNGSLVLKLYYDRNEYEVSYSYANQPAGANALPETATYKYGADVEVAAKATAPGYTFSGWTTSDVEVENAAFAMPAGNVAFTGSFTAKNDTAYKVEHYTEKLNGGYELAATDEKTGVTDTLATAVARTDFTGFTWNSNAEGTVVSGNITGDGKLILKLYYDRNSYTVTYQYVGTVQPEDASALPEQATVKYGQHVDLADDATATGYVFSGWMNGQEAAADFDMPANNVTITGSFSPATDTKYTVKHFLETATDEEYTFREAEEGQGTTGEETAAVAKNYDNFTASPIQQQTIAADGSTVVNVFYYRNSFPVTYSYTGYVPEGASDVPSEESYKFGKTVTVADDATAPAGYTFSGWSIAEESFEMPAKAVSITGSFSANANTAYKVEHYQQKVSGQGYDLFETEELAGTTDTEAVAQAKTYTGFTLNEKAEGTVAKGNINGEGTLVLKLFYDRNSYKVTYKYNNEKPVPGASDLPEEASYLYGADVEIAAPATAAGYTFSGWSRTEGFKMPAEAVEITGAFTAKGDTKYTVEHYQQNVDGQGYTLKDTETDLAGKTDTTATANAKTYTGFHVDYEIEGTVKSGTITGDGKLVLKLYYDRNKYTVSYGYSNHVDGESDLPEDAEYLYEAAVTIADPATATGYDFSGWMIGEEAAADFSMPADNVCITGSWTAGTVEYKIKHYVWNGEEYVLKDTEEKEGTTEVTANATEKEFPGYTYYPGHSDEVKSAEIKADGSTTLKLFYKKNVTVTVSGTDRAGIVYDGKQHVAEGKIESDFEFFNSSSVSFEGSSELPAVAGTAAGTYTSELTADDCINNDPNCEVTFVIKPWSLNIIPKAISIKPDDKQKVYGNPDPEFSGEISGIVKGDEAGISVEYSRTDNSEAVGEYDITAAISGEAAGNYIAEVAAGTLKIDKRQITITSASATKQYDGYPLTAPSVKIGGMGLAEGDSLIVSFGEGQTEIGKSDNIFTEVIVRNNVAMALSSADSEIPEYAIMSDNYDVQKIYGVLTVTEVAAAGAEKVTPDGNADGNGDGGQVIRVTNDDNGNYNVTTIGNGQTPLANSLLDLNCCILHLLIMLAAMLMLLWYTHDMKKRQRKIFELEEQLTEME